MKKKKLICVVGATASGKTTLGVCLAKSLNGEIVSADSRQIFRGLDIGTGKDLQDYGDVRYHLIDICEPGEEFTMFDWLERAKTVLEDIWRRGKVPIIVGGTGLYVQALVQGFKVTKKLKPKTQKCHCEKRFCEEAICVAKECPRQELEQKSKEELQQMLKELDKGAYLKIDLNNPYRLVRAIEKAQNGEKITQTKPDFDYILIGRDLPRDELYSKIDLRVEEWFESGFCQEVAGLIAGGVSLEWLHKIGLEYRLLAQYISQNPSLRWNKIPFSSGQDSQSVLKNDRLGSKAYIDKEFEPMKQEMKWKIHQYARRQLIWWRRFDVSWVKELDQALTLSQIFLSLDK